MSYEFLRGSLPGPKTGAQRVREHRERREAAGLPRRSDYYNLDGSQVPRDRHDERRFIAWDGEGEGTDYTLLGWSNGEEFGSISDPHGLGTLRILEFIQSVADRFPTALHVIYGGSYDFNHWLRDLDRLELRKVLGKSRWPRIEVEAGHPVKFSVVMGKWFHFKFLNRKTGVKVFDVLSFFQTSFVKACDDYITGQYGEESWHERETIVFMKKHRDELSRYSPAEVDYYNRAELVNLVRLANTLRDSAAAVGLMPDSWHGPAALSQRLLRENGVHDHMERYVTDDDPASNIPPEVRVAARFAYAGGRAEMLQWGDIAGPVYEYDLNSAYPAAMQHLPSLKGGTWVHHRGNPQLREDRQHFAVYRVKWMMHPEYAAGRVPGPLPFRRGQGSGPLSGSMCWPMDGETWVWWPEFDVAWRSGCANIQVLEAWVYTPPKNSPKPFAFVPRVFAQRLEMKQSGAAGQAALKLALNSMYGKLAQQTGAYLKVNRKTKEESWSNHPPFHQIEWAGWVTSWCRARVFEAACEKPHDIISFATDAVFSLEPLNLEFGEGLGQWGTKVWSEFCNIQAGFYFGIVDGKPSVKSRGVNRNPECPSDCGRDHEHDYRTLPERIRDGWEDGSVPLSKRGFVTFGLANASDDWFQLWRSWIEVPKVLRFGWGNKRFWNKSAPLSSRGMHQSTVMVVPETGVSAAYSIDWLNYDPTMDKGKLLRESQAERYAGDVLEERELKTYVIAEE